MRVKTCTCLVAPASSWRYRNGLANILTGNHRNNSLTGGLGVDIFVFGLGGGNMVVVLNTTATDAGLLSHIVW